MDRPRTADDFPLTREDIEGITRTSRDYIGSWYAADEERMQSCLHPDLVKHTVVHDMQQGDWKLSRTLNAQMMVDRTRQGGGSDVSEPDRTEEVTILDAFRHVASVKVLSHKYVDYLHVAKFDHRWLIVHALWELRSGEINPSPPGATGSQDAARVDGNAA